MLSVEEIRDRLELLYEKIGDITVALNTTDGTTYGVNRKVIESWIKELDDYTSCNLSFIMKMSNTAWSAVKKHKGTLDFK